MEKYGSHSKAITAIVGGITVLMAFNYYFSYRVLCRGLAQFGIDPSPIIGVEDVTFSFGEINQVVISALIVCFFIALVAWIFSQFFTTKLVDVASSPQVVNTVKKIPKKIKLGMLACLIIGGVVYLVVSFPPETFVTLRKDVGFIIVIGLALALAAVYVKYEQLRGLCIAILIGLIFLWGNLFINRAFTLETPSRLATNKQVSFMYEGQWINTSENLELVYSGYKYVVLYDKAMMRADLYSTSGVSRIRVSDKRE